MPRRRLVEPRASREPSRPRVGEIRSLRRRARPGAHALHYRHPHGALSCGDSLAWLRSLPTASVQLGFADPPYNLGRAAWDDLGSPDQYLAWSLEWIAEAARVLDERGSLYVCGFSEVLADLKRPAMRGFASCRWLVWHYRNKANLGRDWGRSHESLLHLRKTARVRLNLDDVREPYGAHTLRYPSHPQAASSNFSTGRGSAKARAPWQPNPRGAKPKDVFEIPTTSNGMGEKTPHPTQKPEELLRKLVLASSRAGDTVIDPFAGSGTTLVVAEQLGRRWLGCEQSAEYNRFAIARIEEVPVRTVEEWIALDRAQASRRNAIR